MAKKFGRFLMVTAALGAVAAGVYYCLQNKDSSVDDDFDDDDDDKNEDLPFFFIPWSIVAVPSRQSAEFQ